MYYVQEKGTPDRYRRYELPRVPGGDSKAPDTEIRFKEAKLASVIYRGPNRIDVVVKDPTHMHGMMIRASNRDGTQSTYFSYQRTRADGLSGDPVLQYAVPLVPPAAVTEASVDFPGPAFPHTYGVAVQNIEAAATLVTFELLDANGTAIAARWLDIPSNRYVVRTLSELFGLAPDGSCTVRVSSATPVQVIGADADQALGTAAPTRAR